jgi:hypothetical protein
MTSSADALPRPHLQAARHAVAEARQGRFSFRDYQNVVKQLPVLLHRHGLGLTLAYLQMRGGGNRNSPYDMAAGHLDRALFEALGVSGRGPFLAMLCGRDSQFYLEATQHAVLIARALCACAEEQK